MPALHTDQHCCQHPEPAAQVIFLSLGLQPAAKRRLAFSQPQEKGVESWGKKGTVF